MLLAREKQNNLNLNVELKTAISNEITTIPTYLNRTTTSLSNVTSEATPVKLMTPASPNSIVAEFKDVMVQLKEVNKSQRETIQKLDITQNKTNANPTNNVGSHNTTYAPQRLHQWTNDGRSICKKCSKVGHIARECRSGQPYSRFSFQSNHNRPQHYNNYNKQKSFNNYIPTSGFQQRPSYQQNSKLYPQPDQQIKKI